MASTQFTANSNGEKGGKKFGFWALIIVITLAVLILIFNSFTVVNEGYIGVKYQFGKIVSSDLSAGLNMHMPFIEEIQQVDTREQIYPSRPTPTPATRRPLTTWVLSSTITTTAQSCPR